MSRKNITGNKKTITTLFLALCVLGLLIVTSCNPEKKLAKIYVNNRPIGQVLVFKPNMLYKYNLKTDSLDVNKLTEEEKDSVLWFTSDFIQYIDDSTFIDNYFKGYLYGLQQYGIKTYTEENMDDFFANPDSGSIVVNIAQIELEEQYF